MLWFLALYPVLFATSFSQPQDPSPDEETAMSISDPSSSSKKMADSSSVSPNTPLDDANKAAFSSTTLDDTLKILGNLPGTTNQQTQIDVPPETIKPQTPFPHTTFDSIPPEAPAFNQALIDGDPPSFPLLDLLRGIPSNINIPSFGEGSSEEKPTDRDPAEPGEGEQSRYDPEERVENPTPPECGEGRFAMCCNQEPAQAGAMVPLERVWQKRRLCRLCMCFPQRKSPNPSQIPSSALPSTNADPPNLRNNPQSEPTGKAVTGAKTYSAAYAKTSAYGCFSPIYNLDPYYTPYGSAERPPPPPKYFERPTVGENVRRRKGRKPKVPPPTPPPEPPQSMGPPKIPSEGEDAGPFVWEKPDVPGRPRTD
ncbi:hypothetical protein MMC31_004237, partial [Peltigera leucophlebia]|nr:hypothetical protein [Peltigera leucophlebia]